MDMEVTKSNYAINIDIPTTTTVTQCQELVNSLLQYRFVKDAVLVIRSGDGERHFPLQKTGDKDNGN